jgi:hypothetical protein
MSNVRNFSVEPSLGFAAQKLPIQLPDGEAIGGLQICLKCLKILILRFGLLLSTL